MKGTVWILLPNCKQNPRLRLLAPSHPFVLALWREGWALLSPPNPESLPRSGVALALPMHPAERRELRAQFCFVVPVTAYGFWESPRHLGRGSLHISTGHVGPRRVLSRQEGQSFENMPVIAVVLALGDVCQGNDVLPAQNCSPSQLPCLESFPQRCRSEAGSSPEWEALLTGRRS